MVSDYPAANNAQVDSGLWPTPVVAVASSRFREVPAFYSFDLLRDYWQKILLAEKNQDFLYGYALPFGLHYTPTRIPQGILNATTVVSQSTIIEIVRGIHPEKRETQAEMVDNFDRVLERLQGRSL